MNFPILGNLKYLYSYSFVPKTNYMYVCYMSLPEFAEDPQCEQRLAWSVPWLRSVMRNFRRGGFTQGNKGVDQGVTEC